MGFHSYCGGLIVNASTLDLPCMGQTPTRVHDCNRGEFNPQTLIAVSSQAHDLLYLITLGHEQYTRICLMAHVLIVLQPPKYRTASFIHVHLPCRYRDRTW